MGTSEIDCGGFFSSRVSAVCFVVSELLDKSSLTRFKSSFVTIFVERVLLPPDLCPKMEVTSL